MELIDCNLNMDEDIPVATPKPKKIKVRILPKKPISEAITLQDVALLGNELQDAELRVLYYILYLSAGRVSEVLNIRKKDIVCRKDGDKDIVIFTLITKKNRSHPIREVPACYGDDKDPNKYHYEKIMISLINKYTEDMLDEQIIFKSDRIKVWKRFTKAMSIAVRARTPDKGLPLDGYEKKINPHFLRHCRLTHLRKEYNADALTLMKVAGWSNTNPATVYLHLGYKDLAKMFS